MCTVAAIELVYVRNWCCAIYIRVELPSVSLRVLTHHRGFMNKSTLLTCFYNQIHASMVQLAHHQVIIVSGLAKPEFWIVIVDKKLRYSRSLCLIVAWSLPFNPRLQVHLDSQSLLDLTTLVTAFPDRNQVWPFICTTLASHLLYKQQQMSPGDCTLGRTHFLSVTNDTIQESMLATLDLLIQPLW